MATRNQIIRTIGGRLRDRRSELGIPQLVVSQQLGVSRQRISAWESGRGIPAIDRWLDVSDLYVCDWHILFNPRIDDDEAA